MSTLHRKPERRAVAKNMSSGGRGEMGADDEDRLVSPFDEEARAGKKGGSLAVGLVEGSVAVCDLAGMMGDVACDHRLLTLGIYHHAHVDRRVARGRQESNLGRDGVVEIHKLYKSGVEHGLDAIAHHVLLLLVIVGAPVFIFATADEVTGAGKS